MKNNKQINKLKQIITNTLTPLIQSDFALLDVSDYNNIGDNLIWKGQLDFFKTLKINCIYQHSLWYLIDENKMNQVGTLLFQGGGNFGDIYKRSQNYRLNLIEKHTNKRIIILPQSVYYNDLNNLEKDAEILNKHPDLHILVRDRESFELLNKHLTCKIYLVPDMAFFLNRDFLKSLTKENRKNSKNGLFMKRKDSELALSQVDADFSDFDIMDWPTFNYGKTKRGLIYRRERYNHIISNKLIKLGLGNLVDSRFGVKPYNQMNRYTKMGVRFMDEYEKIYTTRLHGLILAILLEKEVHIIDNKLKKLSRFYNQWLSDFDDVYLK